MAIIIVCNLPTLRNPATNMVHDALKAPPYNLRDTQIAELLEQVQNPEEPIDLVLILDGYDELRREYLFKNLYQSNNLETWRERSDKASITWPKVRMRTVHMAADRSCTLRTTRELGPLTGLTHTRAFVLEGINV